MVKIEEKNVKALISFIKGVVPANYESMERLVRCVDFLQGVLESAPPPEPEQTKKQAKEGVKDA